MVSSTSSHANLPRCQALRQGLPFGVVMATAGAAVLATHCGLAAFATPLLVLAMLQVCWATVRGAWRHREERRLGWRAWSALGPAHEHAGIHTVPLGLAVLASGLAALAMRGAAPWITTLAHACLGLAWLLTAVCVIRFVGALIWREWTVRMVDGSWFLVPAALLGSAMATHAVEMHQATMVLAPLALGATLLGWFGYWFVLVLALIRVRQHGLGGVPQAPWWIAMGCAGLAAAALGSEAQGMAPESAWRTLLIEAMVVTDIAALVLCVPVLACSARFLLRRCRFRDPAAWPPTFSTAVLALGLLEAGVVLPSSVFRLLGLGAGCATLVFWVVTTAWNLRVAASRAGGRAV